MQGVTDVYKTAEKIAFQSQRMTVEQLDEAIVEQRLQAYLNGQDPHQWLCEFWKQIHISKR